VKRKQSRQISKSEQEGILKFKNIICIPNSMDLKLMILNEIHKNPYSGHPGYQKMVTTLRKTVLLA
jgi:hypothetical protein